MKTEEEEQIPEEGHSLGDVIEMTEEIQEIFPEIWGLCQEEEMQEMVQEEGV